MSGNNFQLVSLGKKNRKMENRLKFSIGVILKLLKRTEAGLEVYLAGPDRMRFLNKKFRGKNKTADVLSFAAPKNFLYGDGSQPIGEVFLNISELKDGKRAVFLLIHGVLHLLGYDHVKKNDRIKMESKEQEILKCIPL